MVYNCGLSLGFFEHPAVKAFLYRLRPAYYPPNRNQLDSKLLDQCYEDTKKEVEDYIDSQGQLAISFDESNNVASDRIMNIAITTERGAFHYKNIDLGAATISSEFCAEKIENRLQVITKNQMNRINSISTDTCDTIFKTARLLQSFPGLKHTFMISCDPHGLQLLIQDICEFPIFTKVVKQANEIVAHFKSAKKQYQILKELQRQHSDNGKALALIMACDIRWGTYSGEFRRLLSESKALRAFTTDSRVTLDGERAQRVNKALLSRLFWLQLAELEEIIIPIYEYLSTEKHISGRLGSSRDAPLRLAPSPPSSSY
jgi:hypothetical protein